MSWKMTNVNKEKIVKLLEVPPRIAYWELAEVVGKHENTVSKWMRCPNDEQTAQIMSAIDEIRRRQQR